jgi:hypothetical protein
MDEERYTSCLEAGEQRAAADQTVSAAERSRGQGESHETPVERSIHSTGVRGAQPRRCPGGEWLAELQHARVVALQERFRLVRRKPLDAEWSGQADHRPIDSFPAEQTGAEIRVMLTQVEEVVGLRLNAKPPASARLPDHRRTVAPRELVDQPLGPEMLVDVHTGHGATIAIKLIDLI